MKVLNGNLNKNFVKRSFIYELISIRKINGNIVQYNRFAAIITKGQNEFLIIHAKQINSHQPRPQLTGTLRLSILSLSFISHSIAEEQENKDKSVMRYGESTKMDCQSVLTTDNYSGNTLLIIMCVRQPILFLLKTI
jgi:hypothetical protein